MSTQTFTLFAAVFLLICGSHANPLQDNGLPQNIKICKRNDADYSNCLRKAIQDAWPIFLKGIPEIGSPALEPLIIKRVERNFNSGQFVGSLVLSNTTFYGLANTKFLSAQPHFAGNRMKLDLYVKIPKLVIECDYEAQGAVNSVNIDGKGHFNVSMEGFTAKWTLDGVVENDRWIVKHFHIDPEIKGMTVYFSDLFNGIQMLNDAAMFLVNQSWPIFFNGMKPIVVQLSDSHLSNFVNRIVFSRVAISKIFP